MRVSVVDLSGRRDMYAVEYKGDVDRCELDSVLYVSVPRRISARELSSQLATRLRSQWVRTAQALVIRLHSPQDASLLANEDVLGTLRRRFESTALLMAHLDAERQVDLTPLSLTNLVYDRAQLLDAVRFAELSSWLRQPGVVLPANDDFLYEGPNGYRYESFMRVGTAIQGTEMLDAVDFWLQPYLDGSPVVLLDSWTILSVGLNLNRYAVESGAPCAETAGVECLCGYDEDDGLLQARLGALLDPAGVPPPALLVSSVVSSSQLHGKLEDLIRGAGFSDLESVALYGAADAEGTIFCQPEDVARFWHPESEDCPDAPSVPIEPSTYLVNVPAKPKPARLTKKTAKAAWGFFERYRGVDYLSVHRQQEDESRHHLIHVDVDVLAREPKFQKRLGERLAELPEIDVIVSPEHRAAKELASMVSSRLGVDVVFADEDRLPRVGGEDRHKLDAARRFLLVDDTLVTGTRLRGYRNFLLQGGFLPEDEAAEIHLLVGLDRVSDLTWQKRIAEMVDSPNERFHPVESLLLPDWDEVDCPWCAELKLLEEMGRGEGISEALEQRFEALGRTRDGLREGLFIPWRDGGIESLPVSAWKLGHGSIFHVESQIELFGAVASALQRLRAAGELTDVYEYPLARVLELEAWLTGRFYDPVITAAFLRATRRHDLRTFSIETKISKQVRKRFREKGSRDLRGELILAVSRGHLPGPLDLDDELLADGDPGFVAWLRRTLREPAYRSGS